MLALGRGGGRTHLLIALVICLRIPLRDRAPEEGGFIVIRCIMKENNKTRAGGGAHSFTACLGQLTIEHACLCETRAPGEGGFIVI